MDTMIAAALVGLVEGLTEFLPVSSTGHLVLAGELLGLHDHSGADFEIVIQVGAILAVLVLYWRRFWGLLVPDTTKRFSGLRGIGLLILTTLPAASLGLAAKDIIKNLLNPTSVALALAVGAVLMLLVEAWVARHGSRQESTNSIDDLTPWQALGIGCFQCMALWPGFSRSASTIMGGMLMGIRREVAAEYSFIAAVPIIVGAAGYEVLSCWSDFGGNGLFLVVGTITSFVAALFAIKTFIALLGRLTLRPFAIYRLLLVIPVYWFMVH